MKMKKFAKEGRVLRFTTGLLGGGGTEGFGKERKEKGYKER
ncbi:hypothetical protein [Bacillus subtilis]|nr:hypothetical protein [Bacillus subtilis]